MRVRVKVCGMTRREDVKAAAGLGVDAIGLVFYPRSPRYVDPVCARELVESLPAFVTVTALFLDPSELEVQNVLARVHIDLLQFHGNETPGFCRGFGRPYIKAVPMGSHPDLAQYALDYRDAAALLLDSHAAGQKGGTGASFEWSRVPAIKSPPLILAGGLHPGNVASAVAQVRPYGVDVSSGVESAPGIKDAMRLAEFVREVNRVATA